MVAGTMRELGADSDRLHAQVAGELVELEPDLLAVVGDFGPAVAPYAERLGGRLLAAPDPLALAPLLAARVRPGDVVVLKASRGVALERVLPALVPQI
jgi:UDP-N-acetylmuramoyl-tripeptide--D-alanyl-D-alanine ligase